MNIQNLLDKVTALNNKYNELSEISGENYNIFKILKVETSEVRMHSAFLANLLDPNGSHGQKDIFLKEFIRQFKILGEEDLSQIRAKVEVEYNIGIINNDGTTGGRIDIVVVLSSGKVIVIENKIYAGDQTMQLIRYKNKYLLAHFLYLTLDGKEPCPNSTKNPDGKMLEPNKDFFCISYKSDILQWLNQCQKESTQFPLLRETIKQYNNLIKHLTGQTMNEKMKQEIVDIIISNGNNIIASIEISNSVQEAKRKLLLKFAKKLESKVKELNSEIMVEILEKFGNKFQGIFFRLPHLEREYISLSFFTDMSDLYLEVVNENNNNNVLSKNKSNIDYYKEKMEKVSNGWGKIENMEKAWYGDWVCRYNKLDAFFRESENWGDLANGNDYNIINEVSQDVIELIKVLKQKRN